MKSFKSLIVFTLALIFSTFAVASEDEKLSVLSAAGNIEGVITDVNTGEILAGVKVIVEGTDFETLTNLDGKFSLKGLKEGTYNLKLSYISYEDQKVENVSFNTNKPLELSMASE